MTTEEANDELFQLIRRIEILEQDVDKLEELPTQVSSLAGEVKTLTRLVTARFDNIQGPIEKAAGIKTAVQYAAVVIVPILVAIIGGYFVLKGAQVSTK
jgi:hypothetical protein